MAINPTSTSFDYGILGNYYSSGSSLSLKLRAEVLRQGELKDLLRRDTVVPPWNTAQASDEALADRVFRSSQKPLIDLDDPSLDRDGVNGDFRNLFALYKGLGRLKDMAEFARSDPRAEGMRALLDRQFQSLLGQYFDFLGGLSLDSGITLVAGIKQDVLTSTLTLPETATTYLGSTASTDRDQPIPGLAGNERFTIRVTENGTVTDVALDLAELGGAPTIDAVAGLINSKLAADGNIATNVEVKRNSETDYRLLFNLSDGEEISFIADPAGLQPAAYVVGSTGGGDFGSAFLRKFDGLDGSLPNEAFLQRIDSDSGDRAEAVAVDSAGNVYVVGTTAGSLDGQVNAGVEDVYLRKYDPSGREIFTRMLGSTDTASGVAIAIDGDDNVIIAGRTTAPLTDLATGGNGDSFVTKFDASGQELFTRQSAPYGSDGALGLTVDAAGNIFVTGYAEGAIAPGATAGGGKDAYLTKLDAGGALQYSRQIGDAGDEAATAVSVDGDGNVYVLYNDDGRGILRKYADAADGALLFETDLGTLGSGRASGLARDGNGAIYVTGSTDQAGLAGTVASAYAGGTDGFVTRIDEASGAIDYVSYLGSSADDQAAAITVSGGDVYVTGSTGGSIAGAAKVGTVDGYLARLDGATGSVTWAQQFGSGFDQRGAAIAFDTAGSSVLSKLGLPNGGIPPGGAETVTALTSARAGQTLTVTVNGGKTTRVTLAADDSYGFLAFRINQALGQFGTARLVDDGTTTSLQIKALNGARIDIAAGFAGADLLQPLGLKPATLYGDPADLNETEAAAKTLFELGLFDTMSLSSSKGASDAYDLIDNAMRVVRKAYDTITGADTDTTTTAPVGPAPAYLQKQIAAYQGALDKMTQITGSLGSLSVI